MTVDNNNIGLNNDRDDKLSKGTCLVMYVITTHVLIMCASSLTTTSLRRASCTERSN